MQPISGVAVAARAEEANEDLYDVYGSAEDIAWPDEDSDEVNGRETRANSTESREVSSPPPSYEAAVMEVDRRCKDADRLSMISFYAGEMVVDGTDGATAIPVEHEYDGYEVDDVAVLDDDMKVRGREARANTPRSEEVSYENVLPFEEN